MASRSSRRSHLGVPLALGLLFLLVCVAGIAAVVGWIGLSLDAQSTLSAYRGIPPKTCRVCGVVEQVRELGRAPGEAMLGSVENGLFDRGPGLPLGGGEGAAVLLATLGGMMSGLTGVSPPPKIYETVVLLDDGTVRVLRDAGLPPWQPGDRVKVMRGRIEPIEKGAEQVS